MAMIHFGVPRDKASGKDPLGYGREEFHPEFYAMNALKASLLIQNELGKISSEFRKELLKIAKKKFSPPKIEENDEWAKYLMDEEQWYIDRLREEIGISTTIDTTQVVGTHKAAFAKVTLGIS